LHCELHYEGEDALVFPTKIIINGSQHTLPQDLRMKTQYSNTDRLYTIQHRPVKLSVGVGVKVDDVTKGAT
jgi:hypothetical protein